MTINPVTAARAIVAIVKAIRARRAKRRHDVVAVPGGPATVERFGIQSKCGRPGCDCMELPECATDQE